MNALSKFECQKNSCNSVILQVLSPTLVTYPKTVQYIHPNAHPVGETIQHQLMQGFSVPLGLRLLSQAQDRSRTEPDDQPGSGLDSEPGLGQYVPLHIGHPNFLIVILGGLPIFCHFIVRRARETSGTWWTCDKAPTVHTDELHSNRIHAWHTASWPIAAGISFS